MNWYIGCSGFHYKHWKDVFYPKGLAQRLWFTYYSEQFSTLELNVTFYRFPQVAFLKNWYSISPENFRFAVKAPRTITHYKQFHNCTAMLSDFYGIIVQGLEEKLGPVLFQMPPRFTYTEEKLARIIDSMDLAFRNVLEFRHPSWWQQSIFETLAKHHISFCGMSHPELPDSLIHTTNLLYYRFHGVPDLYRTLYSHAYLNNTVSTISQQPDLSEAWLYFNNDMEAHAPQNALEMLRLLNGNSAR